MIGDGSIVGTMKGSITSKTLRAEMKRRGGTVEDDSAGRWHVLQLTAPEGKVWSEGVKHIKVEWPFGQSSLISCTDAWKRISSQSFRDMTESEKDFFEE
jgi:hypothetical protein